MNKYILVRIDKKSKQICLIKRYFNNERDAQIFLKGIQIIKPQEKYDIVELKEI